MIDPAGALRAFAEETRLRILRLISSHELCVSELVEALEVPQSSISRHLAALKQSGLLKDRREGTWVYYSLVSGEPFAASVWAAIGPHLDAAKFFPDDLKRLEDVLSRRESRTRAYFDVVASEWDRIRRLYIDDTLAFHVVASLVQPDAVVLEVGTGTGELLVALGARVTRVIGVDESEKMLDLCRERVAKHGLTNVTLKVGKAETLPVADGECSVAFSGMLLHHLADPARGIREMARVVAPGGRVVLSDLVKHDYDWTREVMADVWLGFTEEQVRQWLTEAGLRDITWSSAALPMPIEDASSGKLRAFIATATRP
jgi:ArsR family transcriptional regulator